MQHLSRLEITGCVRSMRSREGSGSASSLYVKRNGRSSSSVVKAREHLHEQ